jgi:hypothetical protein
MDREYFDDGPDGSPGVDPNADSGGVGGQDATKPGDAGGTSDSSDSGGPGNENGDADADSSSPTPTYTIGGTVVGLVGTGLELHLERTSAGPAISESTFVSPAGGADVPFTFVAELSPGDTFTVSDPTLPSSPSQNCSVSGGEGEVGSGNITGIIVNCGANTFTVGGNVSGLEGTLTLLNNGGDALPLPASFAGEYTFSTPLTSAANYSVTTGAHSALPVQTCTVSSPSGKVGSANVTNVNVSCTTATFTVSGTLSGVGGASIQLSDNGTDLLTRSSDGTFVFGAAVKSNRPYDVKIATPPANKTCVVTSGSGTVTNANVGGVLVSCVDKIAFSENFDGVGTNTLPALWTSSVLAGPGSANPFATSSASSDTAPNAAAVSEASQASDIVLTSPTFTVATSQAVLTFRHSFDLEGDPVDATIGYDGGVLEVSIAGGAFQDILAAGGVFSTGGYNRYISSLFTNPLAGRQAWSKSSGGFITTTVSLPATAGQSVRLRFREGTDKQNIDCPCIGWKIDTIVVSN